ncbi:MAG: asparagine synthase B [Armatimonadota bacterium]
MCGIAGILGKQIQCGDLGLMLSRLSHRGPDDNGRCTHNGAKLGHARLSIIDVDGGRQPLFNEDGTICIVFNGEIYNHRALRTFLEPLHTFTTHTDTEVILHLYEEFGEKCLALLDGMFAFAISDTSRGLFLARDPLGIKPLYTSWRGDCIYFASEMKAFRDVVDEYEEFPAGHYYQTDCGLQRYFSISDKVSTAPEEENSTTQLRCLLERAVIKRLMSDVPLGVFLSGGLDSSIIAAIAARHIPNLKTFSVGTESSEDRVYATLCSEYLGTDHYERTYTIDDMLVVLPKVIYYLESYDAALIRSAIPNYFLAQLASEHVKVVLSGEGADELFSGYHYLKDLDSLDLNAELLHITNALHNTNLQRCDRMSMAHGLEARVPFLDVEVVRFAFSLSNDLKLGPDNVEKWILRQAFKDCLPGEIAFRRKSKFSEGCGSSMALAAVAEEISDAAFNRCSELPDGSVLRSKEELMYYRIFRELFPSDSAHKAVGRSRSL